MRYDLKHKEGKFIWKYHGLVEKPKYINVRCILGHTRSTGNYLIQLTLKLHTKQVIVIISFSVLFLYIKRSLTFLSRVWDSIIKLVN